MRTAYIHAVHQKTQRHTRYGWVNVAGYFLSRADAEACRVAIERLRPVEEPHIRSQLVTIFEEFRIHPQ